MMKMDTVKAIVNNGGGWDKVIELVFDEGVFVIRDPFQAPFSESDFVKFGDEYCYKEEIHLRDNKEYDYNITAYTYHSLNDLQAVVMVDKVEDVNKLDVSGLHNMLAHRH